MAIDIYVGGVDMSDKVKAGAPLRYEDMLNGRSTLSLTFQDDVGGFRPEDGAEILLMDGDDCIFGGMLLEPEEMLVPGTTLLIFSCQATDFSGICDRHLVARAYAEQTLQAIVLDIVMQEMAEEGIDTSGVETGPTVKKAVFNWVNVTQAFNELAELSGMAWWFEWIDGRKVLHFRERSSIAAPVELNADTAGSVRVRKDRQEYRNHQVLRAGAGLTDPRTELFVGDGERRTFNLAFKAGTEPEIEVNATPQTVGIRGLETGKQWYWNKGATEVSQDSGESVLTDTDTLEVTYEGLFPIIISASRGSEITARQAIEGGSGRYSRVEERANIETVDAAIAAVQAILDRYATIGRVFQCATAENGLRPGQLVTVDFPEHDIDEETFLIESVSGSLTSDGSELWYEVRALSGDPFGGWQEYFRKIQRIGRQFVIRENEVVVGLNELSDSATAADAITEDADAPESRVGFARVGFSTVGAA